MHFRHCDLTGLSKTPLPSTGGWQSQKLAEAQEHAVIGLRKDFLLSLDNLLAITRQFIHSQVTRSDLHSVFCRHGVSNLRKMKQALSDTAPGTVHVTIRHLPKMEQETIQQYLFIAIERGSGWAYLETFTKKSAKNVDQFRERLIHEAPFNVNKIVTDK